MKRLCVAAFNPSSANFTKCSNTLKQFIGKFQTNCLSVFDHFVGLALKGLIWVISLWTITKYVVGKFLYFRLEISHPLHLESVGYPFGKFLKISPFEYYVALIKLLSTYSNSTLGAPEQCAKSVHNKLTIKAPQRRYWRPSS